MNLLIDGDARRDRRTSKILRQRALRARRGVNIIEFLMGKTIKNKLIYYPSLFPKNRYHPTKKNINLTREEIQKGPYIKYLERGYIHEKCKPETMVQLQSMIKFLFFIKMNKMKYAPENLGGVMAKEEILKLIS